jgi:hypothetical protein
MEEEEADDESYEAAGITAQNKQWRSPLNFDKTIIWNQFWLFKGLRT